ncbi:MAG: ABC transporter permease [Planctomycetota bacterium]
MIDGMSVLIVAHKELRDARRNRWFLLYGVALAALALAFSGLGLAGKGRIGLTGFARTTASLINLVMLIVPLMGLTLGALSLAAERERGTLLYLLSQPVTQLEVFLGKYLGLGAALLGTLVAGFGISGVIVALQTGGGGVGAFLALVALSFVLGLISLGLGMLLSAFARRGATSLATAVFLWLLLVFMGDLGVMGTALVLELEVDRLLLLALVNPLQVFKLGAILASRGSLEVLGPAGVYAVRNHGEVLWPVLLALLGAWVLLPPLGGFLVFRRRGVL